MSGGVRSLYERVTAFARSLFRREAGPAHPQLPEWDAASNATATDARSAAPELLPLAGQAGQTAHPAGGEGVSAFSLNPPAQGEPEEFAQRIYDALERESRLRSQDLWGEDA